MLISLIRNLKLILHILHIPALYFSALENDRTVNKLLFYSQIYELCSWPVVYF